MSTYSAEVQLVIENLLKAVKVDGLRKKSIDNHLRGDSLKQIAWTPD